MAPAARLSDISSPILVAMEHLSEFLGVRFARVTASTKILLLSHARDSRRDESDTHSGRILLWMEKNLEIVCVPLYGELPHDAQGQLGVHPSVDMREVAVALTPFLHTIRQFLKLGRCVFLGNEPAKVLRYALDATTLEPAMQLPHPQHWDRKQAGTDTLGVNTVIQGLRPLHDSPKWDVLPSVVQSTRQTSKRLAAQRETGPLVGKLIHPPASEKKRANCRAVGRIWGGVKKATARSRASSSAVGKITGRRKLYLKQRAKCAETALRTNATPEGRARQRQKGFDMVAKRDEEKTKEAGRKGREEHQKADGASAHVNIEDLRGQIQAGFSLDRLAHYWMRDKRLMRDLLSKEHGIPADSIADEDLSPHFDSEAQRQTKALYKIGFTPSKIQLVLDNPVKLVDIAKFLGLKSPEHIPAREPMKNAIKGEWFSKEQLGFLVQNFKIVRLARCFLTSFRGHYANWVIFLERIKAGEDVVNPRRMPKKTMRKQNKALRNNVDIHTEVAKHNAELDLEMRAYSQEKRHSHTRRREEEDAVARQRLQERKKARASSKSTNPLSYDETQ